MGKLTRDTPITRAIGELLDRFDRTFGPESLGVPWWNRLAKPTSPQRWDAEMEVAPTNYWSWAAPPWAINSGSGVTYTEMPHYQYVYILGSGTAVADQRVTDPGNLPRYKVVTLAIPRGYPGWQFTMRSVVDGNNYIEWLVTPSQAEGWKCVSGVRTQIGTTVPLYPPTTLWFSLGNYVGGNLLTWAFGAPWPFVSDFLGVAEDAGQQAHQVQYLQLLYAQPSVAQHARYLIDAVRFGSTEFA